MGGACDTYVTEEEFIDGFFLSLNKVDRLQYSRVSFYDGVTFSNIWL